MKTKFEIGDKVKIINYGHLMWCHKDSQLPGNYKFLSKHDNVSLYDTAPELIGQIGIVTQCGKTQGEDRYSLSGIQGKCSWYHNDQLELVNKNPNNES